MKRWQQYGISISAAWAIGVTSYIRYQELPKAQAYATQSYFVCADNKAALGQRGIELCTQNVSRDWDEWMNRKWGKIAYISLVPITAGWLLAYVGIFVYRRIKADRPV